MKKIEQKAILFIKENNLIKKGEHILIALSGGADSVFAIYFLHKFKSFFGITFSAFHLNHMLRGKEADLDERFCVDICKSLSVPLYVSRKRIKQYSAKQKISIEEAGREIRYNELESLRRKIKADKILTAHNLDDNSETILLNLFKGTGLKGLIGIPVKRGNIIRPFISLEKDDIVEYLRANKIKFRTDVSNLDEKYKRNLIRHKILSVVKEQLNPSVNYALLNVSQKIGEIEKELSAQKINSFFKVEKNEIILDVNCCINLSETMFGEVIKGVLRQKFSYTINTKNNRKLFRLLANQKGTKIDLGNDVEAVRESEEIIIRKKQIPKHFFKKIKINSTVSIPGGKLTVALRESIETDFGVKNLNKEYISGDNLSDRFILRNWKNGDKFKPLGMKGFKKVSDFLNDEKIKTTVKREFLVLENNGNIVWLVGLRIDDRFKINKNTKRKIELCLN